MVNALLTTFVWQDHEDPALDPAQAQAAYEAGIEAFVQQEPCPYPKDSALYLLWRRGFEDARRDLSSVWRDASQVSVQPEFESLVRLMTPAERRAMIAWLAGNLDSPPG